MPPRATRETPKCLPPPLLHPRPPLPARPPRPPGRLRPLQNPAGVEGMRNSSQTPRPRGTRPERRGGVRTPPREDATRDSVPLCCAGFFRLRFRLVSYRIASRHTHCINAYERNTPWLRNRKQRQLLPAVVWKAHFQFRRSKINLTSVEHGVQLSILRGIH